MFFLFFCIVVFSYLVSLFYFIILFHFALLYVWFVCFLVSLYVSYECPCFLFWLFFQIAASGREGFLLSSFCLICSFILLFFSRGEGYFNSLLGRLRDSSCAGQSMRYVSVLGAYNNFVGGRVD